MKRHLQSVVCDRIERIGTFAAMLAAGALLGSGGSQAMASAAGCGATITTDTKLTSDLTSCPNNGIVIGADDITLDLGGHTISGDGTPVESCPESEWCDVGIDTAGHSGVTIKGGTVRDFAFGVVVAGGSDDRVTRLTSTANAIFGLLVIDSAGARVDHNSSASDGFNGIHMDGSHDARIDHNVVVGAHGYAIPVRGSSRIRVERNVLDHNDHGILFEDTDDTAAHANRISHSGGSSIDMGPANGNRITENVLTDDGDGIILGNGSHNEISGNTVTGTGFFGFPDTGGFGMVIGGDHNIVARNTVTGGRGQAIFVGNPDEPDSQGTSDANVISHNVANSELDDGIFVTPGATAALLERNTADGNGDDGIDVRAPGTRVTANTTNDNRDLGIEAVLGTIDGGGNRARGNGNALQCTNVSCS